MNKFKTIDTLSLNISEKDYRKLDALSYSTIAKFSREGYRKLATLFESISSPSLIFGGLVDCLITEPEEFNNKYEVATFPNISDFLSFSINNLFLQIKDLYSNLEDVPDDIILKHLGDNWYKNLKPITRINKYKKECSDYFKLLSKSKNRSIIDAKDFEDARKVINVLYNSPFTKKYFNICNEFNNKPNEIQSFYQLKFIGIYNDITIKCMFDQLVVDHKRKIIYPVDLKTTGFPEEDFETSFIKWCYYIQAQLYSYILKQAIEKDPFYKDYKIAEYTFIVVSRNTLSPLAWTYNGNFIETDLIDKCGNRLKNWRVLLEELTWYLNNPPQKYSREILTGKKKLVISNLKSINDIRN